jgi:molybdopterin/thiamine biosynthesis adenylyltransferase/rhodanese-related sulfurtransferase
VQRFGRQLIVPEIGLEGQRRLAAARVLIVGLGGLGCSAALALATAGVGELRLMDPDHVERSNLHRQVLYTERDLDRPKVEAASEALRARVPELRVLAERAEFGREDAVQRVRDVEVVVDASDNFPTRYRVSSASVRARRPDAFAAVHRLEGQVALFDPNGGPCYRCLFEEAPPPDHTAPCGEAGVLGPLPGLLGQLQALEVLRHLLGWRQGSSTTLTIVDAQDLSFRQLALHRRLSCVGCAPGSISPEMPAEPVRPVLPLEEGFRFVGAHELTAELASGLAPELIDLRTAEERALGVFPEERWIPFEEFPGRLGEITDLRRPVLFCQWGGRSERAARLAAEAGLRNVRVLEGGYEAYSALRGA